MSASTHVPGENLESGLSSVEDKKVKLHLYPRLALALGIASMAIAGTSCTKVKLNRQIPDAPSIADVPKTDEISTTTTPATSPTGVPTGKPVPGYAITSGGTLSASGPNFELRGSIRMLSNPVESSGSAVKLRAGSQTLVQ